MIRQRTIRKPVRIEGVGLQTGRKVTVALKDAPANSGINFIRTDLPNKPLISIQSLDLSRTPPGLSARPPDLRSDRIGDRAGGTNHESRTTIGDGLFEIQTTEHLLAALSGLSIDNIIIELDGIELPGLDGSAKGFVDAIKTAGIIEGEAPKKVLKIDKPTWCSDGDSLLAVFPDDKFRISYTLSYNRPGLGTQFLSVTISGESFEKEIAPARTFCLEEEALELLKRGLGKGANYENTLVMGKSGPINNTLRFPDEPVRHKILDLVGDLYLAGMPIQGHVVGIKSGHRLNLELVKRLKG